LIERVLEHYRGRAVDLAQVLIDPAEKSAVRVYAECKFERLAELVYLDREVHRAHAHALPAELSWLEYSPATHEEFSQTIASTYEASLDCPSLNGRRQIEDVIAGHKAAGEFDPKLWFLLREHEEPVGALLLNRSPRTDALELVYLGLIRAARGRGLGDVIMTHALATAAAVGARRLSLAVDSKNAPALKLYHRHGLSRICTRLALIRDLRDRKAAAPVSTELSH
jgi:ribosomal protein S18 acetylase RimI-like enzyme